jgi:hypothetical protein
MRRRAIAVVGLVLAGWGAALLHAQTSRRGADRPVDVSEFRQMVAETQASLQVLASETGGFAQTDRTAQRDDDLPHGGGIIRGHVTDSATGAPIHAATISALLTSLDAVPVTTVTDSDGRFELRGLRPGRWRLDAAKAGFIGRSYGQRGTSRRVRTITLEDRDSMTAHVALERSGVATGRVLDQFGEPAVGAFVQVMRHEETQNGRWLTPAGVADITDDTGAYRVYGLLPGEYFVSARSPSTLDRTIHAGEGTERRADVGASGGGAPPAGLSFSALPTYFPGTLDISRAERVTLDAGEMRAGLDFSLDRTPPARVSGTIVESSGEPPTRPVSIVLAGGSLDPTMTFLNGGPVLAANGAFSFRNVPPGQYFVTVGVQASGGHAEFADVPITVGAEDITDLHIGTAPGIALTGTVVSIGDGLPDLRGMRVVASPFSGRRLMFPSTTASVIDGVFQVPNLPGTFQLLVQGVPAGWTVQSIEIDGSDVTDQPVTIMSGRPQATVVLTNRQTALSGAVTMDRKPIDAEIAIFPDDPAMWTSRRFVREVRADEQGMFSLRGLPPHDRYLAVAIDNIEPGDLQDPEFLERARARATSFALEAGQSHRLSLTLVDRSAIDGR